MATTNNISHGATNSRSRASLFLSLVGYDPMLCHKLSNRDHLSLVGNALAWSFSCSVLGLCAAIAAFYVFPTLWAAACGGSMIFVLALNLVRVANAGGGCHIGQDLSESEMRAQRYRPSLVPSMVFTGLAMILAQPAQLVFWQDLDQEVEVHRQALVRQHILVTQDLGANHDYYRQEIESSTFPVFRIQRLWQEPSRVLRYTVLTCLLVLVAALWSQFVSIRALRAYELFRCRRAHLLQDKVLLEGEVESKRWLVKWSGLRSSDSLPSAEFSAWRQQV